MIEKGYKIIKEGAIDKLQNFLLTGDHNVIFSKKEYMQYYTIVFNLCSLKFEQAQSILYAKFTQSIKDYLNTNVVDELKIK